MIKKVEQEIKKAMVSKDTNRLRALRSLKTVLFTILTDNPSIKELSDEEAIKCVHKQIKQRKESLVIYLDNNRYDLAQIEVTEIEVLEEFLPKQLSIGEVTDIIKKIISDNAFTGIKDMGAAMKIVTKELAGKIDNKTIGTIVKENLI